MKEQMVQQCKSCDLLLHGECRYQLSTLCKNYLNKKMTSEILGNSLVAPPSPKTEISNPKCVLCWGAAPIGCNICRTCETHERVKREREDRIRRLKKRLDHIDDHVTLRDGSVRLKTDGDCLTKSDVSAILAHSHLKH